MFRKQTVSASTVDRAITHREASEVPRLLGVMGPTWLRECGISEDDFRDRRRRNIKNNIGRDVSCGSIIRVAVWLDSPEPQIILESVDGDCSTIWLSRCRNRNDVYRVTGVDTHGGTLGDA